MFKVVSRASLDAANCFMAVRRRGKGAIAGDTPDIQYTTYHITRLKQVNGPKVSRCDNRVPNTSIDGRGGYTGQRRVSGPRSLLSNALYIVRGGWQ